MDAATSNPLFQAVDKMLSRAILPDVKAPVDLLALIQEYGDAKFKYGAQSVSDRWHQEYADAPDLGPITDEVERLQGAEFVLLEACQAALAAFSDIAVESDAELHAKWNAVRVLRAALDEVEA